MFRSRKVVGRITMLLALLLVSSLACSLSFSLDSQPQANQNEKITPVVPVTQVVPITQVVIVTQVITSTPIVNDDAMGPGWQKQSPALAPSPRKQMGFVYDTRRGVVVALGGTDWIMASGETWEYDGANWTLREDVKALPARLGAAAAFDSKRQVTVLFGGSGLGDNEFFNDTWEYDGKQWVLRLPAHSPPVRNGAAMAYDSQRQSMLLFGGYDRFGSTRFFDDTWEYVDSEWIQRFPAHHPTARESAHLVYDTARGKLVMFGGGHDAGSVNYNETWEWSGEDWTLRTDLPASPSARWAVSMAYDEDCQRVFLFGGLTGLTNQYKDTWTYDGKTWTQVAASWQPSARWDAGLAYDQRNHLFVLFGGQYWNGQFGFLGDTWRFAAPCE
jgi:hypothetical protein